MTFSAADFVAMEARRQALVQQYIAQREVNAMKLGEKAMTVLRVAAMPMSPERWAAYEAACEKYSAKAVEAMFYSLTGRGYIEFGVTARTGWLTDKGREALR